jgi:hypothetical protein
MKALTLLIGIPCIFLASAATAASVGLYTSVFDPPTRAQLQMIRCTLGEPDFREACRELGKKISRVVVLVSKDHERDALASSRERELMIRKALQKHGERVEVLVSTPVQKEQRKRALLDDPDIERVYQLFGADSYRALKSSPSDLSPKVAWVVFPLAEEEVSLRDGPAMHAQVDSAVGKVIDKLGLYQEVGADLAHLQRAFFEEGWEAFLQDLQIACPTTLRQDQCAGLASRWEEIVIVPDEQLRKEGRRKPADKVRLVHKKAQSADRWAEKFTTAAMQFLQGTESYDKLKPVADDIAARMLQGYPHGKLPHVSKVSTAGKTSAAVSIAAERPLACSAPQGSYIADMDRYLADRFPRALSRFLKEERKRLIAPVDLYVHDHPLEEAYELHRRAGYETFYFVQTRRGHLHRNLYLAARSDRRAYRVVVTNVRGRDRTANVMCQLQRTGVFPRHRFVQAREAQPLFVLNRQGQSLTLQPTDWLLFGFKGDWSRRLLAQGFRRVPLVEKGLDIDLFSRPGIGTKLVVARNVYGDDVEIVLNTFYQKGMRQAIYIGSAGAIVDYKMGDVVIPNEFVDRHKNSAPFPRNFARTYQSELSKHLTVHGDKKQAWVQSLFDETKEVLLDWKANAVGSVDIEGLHLGRFASRHNDLKLAAFFVISDETLGDLTIEQTNAYRGVIDASVAKLITFLLPKLEKLNYDAESREPERKSTRRPWLCGHPLGVLAWPVPILTESRRCPDRGMLNPEVITRWPDTAVWPTFSNAPGKSG